MNKLLKGTMLALGPEIDPAGLELPREAEPSHSCWLNSENEITKLTSGLCMMHSTFECG